MSTTLTADPTTTRRRAGTIALWALQAVLAVQFATGGLLKVTGDPQMVAMFTAIGTGQWLRYVVGALEITGAVGLLVPRLCGLAALGLVGLMVGAAITNVAFLGQSPVVPAAFLLVSALIAWRRRSRTVALPDRFRG